MLAANQTEIFHVSVCCEVLDYKIKRYKTVQVSVQFVISSTARLPGSVWTHNETVRLVFLLLTEAFGWNICWSENRSGFDTRTVWAYL